MPKFKIYIYSIIQEAYKYQAAFISTHAQYIALCAQNIVQFP